MSFLQGFGLGLEMARNGSGYTVNNNPSVMSSSILPPVGAVV